MDNPQGCDDRPVVLVAHPDWGVTFPPDQPDGPYVDRIRLELSGRAEVVYACDSNKAIDLCKKHLELKRLRVVVINSELPTKCYGLGAHTADVIRREMGFSGYTIGVPCCYSEGYGHPYPPALLRKVGCDAVTDNWTLIAMFVCEALGLTSASAEQLDSILRAHSRTASMRPSTPM